MGARNGAKNVALCEILGGIKISPKSPVVRIKLHYGKWKWGWKITGITARKYAKILLNKKDLQ